jgi:L-amino acid N-acyltransferase
LLPFLLFNSPAFVIVQPVFENIDSVPMMQIVQCTHDRHAAAILAIFNDAILNSTALYDYKPRTREMMTVWFEIKAKGKFPVFGIENDSGELMGFGSYGTFRAFPAYKYTVEHSIYVDARFRGCGVGKRLLQEVITAAQRQDYHVLVGAIDASNAVSIRLHESLGFSPCGTIRQAGFKFNRWLDLVFYQLILKTPGDPRDG